MSKELVLGIIQQVLDDIKDVEYLETCNLSKRKAATLLEHYGSAVVYVRGSWFRDHCELAGLEYSSVMRHLEPLLEKTGAIYHKHRGQHWVPNTLLKPIPNKRKHPPVTEIPDDKPENSGSLRACVIEAYERMRRNDPEFAKFLSLNGGHFDVSLHPSTDKGASYD